MNIRNVLSTYKKLRDLTDDETALLETLRRFTDAEREAFVEALQPQKVAKKASKKSSNKSSRASGMAAAIKGSLSQRRQITLCGFVYPDGSHCNQLDDNPIHAEDGGYAGYHEFDAGKPSASPAPHVGGKSSTNGGATSSTANSEDETVNDGAVAGGSNG